MNDNLASEPWPSGKLNCSADQLFQVFPEKYRNILDIYLNTKATRVEICRRCNVTLKLMNGVLEHEQNRRSLAAGNAFAQALQKLITTHEAYGLRPNHLFVLLSSAAGTVMQDIIDQRNNL